MRCMGAQVWDEAAPASRSETSGRSAERLEQRRSSREGKSGGVVDGYAVRRGRDGLKDRADRNERRGGPQRGQLGDRERGGERAALAVITAAACRIVVWRRGLPRRAVEHEGVERRQPEAASDEHEGEEEGSSSACYRRQHASKLRRRLPRW